MPELDLAPVQGPDVAPDPDRSLAVLNDPSHRSDQAVGIEDHIGVGAQGIRISGGVDPGVQGICPSSVLLVDDRDVEGAVAPIDAPDRSSGDVRPIGDSNAFEMEGFDQGLERPVDGTVVDDHDLEARVTDDRHRPDRVHYSRRLVVGGNHYRDRRRCLTGEHLGDAAESIEMVHPAHDCSRPHPETDHVDLHEDEVDDSAVSRPAQDLVDHDSTWRPAPT